MGGAIAFTHGNVAHTTVYMYAACMGIAIMHALHHLSVDRLISKYRIFFDK